MQNYTDWTQDNTISPSRRLWDGRFNPDTPFQSLDQTGGTSEQSNQQGDLSPVETSCIGQSDCAVGFSCLGGVCISTQTSNPGSNGGCGTGGTGGGVVGGDYGCIEIGGGGSTGGCTTGTCGDVGGNGPGGAEYCCGDWVCDGDAVTGEVTCECVTPGGSLDTCNVESDCPAGSLCSGGFCIPDFRECESDNQCPENYTCSGGFCIFDGWNPSACEVDSDCPDNYECIGGFCRYNWRDCDEETACGSGEICIGGICYPGCSNDSECEPGETCLGNFCTDQCFADDECPDGEICMGGFCMPGCADDSDCPDNYECVGTFCYPKFTQCEGDYQCNSSEACYGGLCYPAPSTCTEGQCLENQICILGECFGFGALPDFGDLDFSNCATVSAAEINSVYVATKTVLSNCFDGFFQPCGGIPTKNTEVLITAGQRYVKTSSNTWIEISCGGEDAGWTAEMGELPLGGGILLPPSPPLPFQRCDDWCAAQFESGLFPERCIGVPRCGKCEFCAQGGICKPYGQGVGPCYCESNRCQNCLECQENGNCKNVENPSDCKACCTVCRDCDGEKVCRTTCRTEGAALCLEPTCEEEEEPPECDPCKSTHVCDEGGVTAVCPEGYEEVGVIEAGGGRCVICSYCDPTLCQQDGEERTGCNCDADCAQNEICSASGECIESP